MKEIVLLGHVLFGVGCIIAAVWVLVDVLNANEGNRIRIKWMSRAVAVFMWLAFAIGGFWYVADYSADKAVILKGPWPFAHDYFMETKEHFVITLLLLATYLPIAASNNLAANKVARRLVLCVAALVAVLGLMAEGHGAIIAMGVKGGAIGQTTLNRKNTQWKIPASQSIRFRSGGLWHCAPC